MIIAAGLASYSIYERKKVQLQHDRANQSLAEAIDNDLGIRLATPLTARQRNALWKLTVVGHDVREDFVSTIAGGANEVIRASAGLPKILRALGPLNQEDKDIVVNAAIDGIQATNDTREVLALAQALKELSAKLPDLQAQQAANAVRIKIVQNENTTALPVLAQALQALPLDPVNKKQAQLALDTALARLEQTTEPNSLQALAETLLVLPVA